MQTTRQKIPRESRAFPGKMQLSRGKWRFPREHAVFPGETGEIPGENRSPRNCRGLLFRGPDQCLDYILAFGGQFYDPRGAILGITDEQAAEHNRCLSALEIERLDSCKIGQPVVFYLRAARSSSGPCVVTWTGQPVSEDVLLSERAVSFFRDGCKYTGLRTPRADSVVFERVR